MIITTFNVAVTASKLWNTITVKNDIEECMSINDIEDCTSINYAYI